MQNTLKFVSYFPIVLSGVRIRFTEPSKPSSYTYILKHIFRDAIIFFPALFFILQQDFLTFTLNFSLLYVACYSLYEIGYLYNDCVTVKKEDKPKFRSYTQLINWKNAILIRIIILFILLYYYWNTSLIIPIFLLTFAMTVHNSLHKNSDRILTTGFERLVKALFVPIAMIGIDYHKLYPCLVLILPILAVDVKSNTLTITKKYFDYDKIMFEQPYWKAFMLFLPLQIIALIYYPIQVLSGEIILALASLIAKMG